MGEGTRVESVAQAESAAAANGVAAEDFTPVRELSVLVAGQLAGTLGKDRAGMLRFAYDPSYCGADLSLSMPRREGRAWSDSRIRPWLEGLLPDNRLVREGMALSASAQNDTFSLLEHYGEDCPGAIQLFLPGEEGRLAAREGELVPISDASIRARLESALDGAEPRWTISGESWSLGGNQAKLALRLDGGAGDSAEGGAGSGRWMRCLGSAATTHIVKPGIAAMKLQALDEYFCIELASRVGLRAARVEYREFDGMPAIVVERFDRVQLGEGAVLRLHQEDLCQALGFPPSKKYTSDGGPTAQDVLQQLKTGADAESADRFTEALFFNYLIGASDAHAKNYSILHLGEQRWALAPLYDVASAFPYDRRDGKAWRCAMSIGGENRIGWLRGSAIRRFESAAGIPEGRCRDLVRSLAEDIPDALSDVFARTAGIPGIDELRPRLEAGIVKNCARALANLDVAGRGMRF